MKGLLAELNMGVGSNSLMELSEKGRVGERSGERGRERESASNERKGK